MKRLTVSENSSSHLCTVLIAASSFSSLVVDGAAYMNSSWICLCLGFILSIPIILSVGKISSGFADAWILYIPLSAYYSFQAAAVSRILINSVSYSNLENIPPLILSAIMLCICLYIVFKNSSGIGNALKLMFIMSAVLLAIIAAGNFGYMNFRWLTPVLSTGTMQLLRGSIISAGNISSAALIFTACVNRSALHKKLWISTSAGFAAALFLCLYSEVMTPMQTAPETDRLRSIEIFLANGRTSLGIQFPITVMWFLGYIAALAAYTFCSAVTLQKAFSKSLNRIPAIIATLTAFIIANCGLAESQNLIRVGVITYPAALLFITIILIKNRRKHIEAKA